MIAAYWHFNFSHNLKTMQSHFRPRVTKANNYKEVELWKRLINIVTSKGGIERFVSVYFGNSDKVEKQYHKEETSYLDDGAKMLKVDSTKIRTVEELIIYHEIDTSI